MKHEAKFIGRTDTGEWIVGHYSERKPFIDIRYYIGANKVLYQVDKQSVGQYVGLKDKNEKEIYSDVHIFKFKLKTLERLNIFIELVGVFTFNDIELRYEIDIYSPEHNYVCLSYVSTGQMYDFEIIGTVQENPELITLK